jgi:hypothetical protein
LWATKQGGNKAFGIRVANAEGRLVRKTFDLKEAWRTRFDFAYCGIENVNGLGDYLDEAREWARDQVDGEKARPTVRDEHSRDVESAGGLVAKMTFGDAARSLISGMRANGRSERYVDRLDKLFSNQVSPKLQNIRLDRLTAKPLARCLVNVKLPAGNIRILRSFIGQIFERAGNFRGPLLGLREELAEEFRKQWDKSYDVRYPELRKLKDKHFQKIFKRLESEEEFWTSALCIRLFFEFHSPLKRVLRGRWNQIDGDHWYPYFPSEKVLWFECRERIEDASKNLLAAISKRGADEFGTSPFWFPSLSNPARCTSSVDLMWRKTLADCRMQFYPLREFARSFREPNCPSHHINFLRQYGGLFRRHQNMAELSKRLISQQEIV